MKAIVNLVYYVVGASKYDCASFASSFAGIGLQNKPAVLSRLYFLIFKCKTTPWVLLIFCYF